MYPHRVYKLQFSRQSPEQMTAQNILAHSHNPDDRLVIFLYYSHFVFFHIILANPFLDFIHVKNS